MLLTPTARSTDPDTSFDAAASITPTKLRDSQEAVLSVLGRIGPCTQDDLVRLYDDVVGAGPLRPRQSPSGIRTRLKELVRLGKAVDTGRRARLASGRMAIIWEKVD